MILRLDKPCLFMFFLLFTLLWTSPFHAQNLDLKELENEVIGASGMQRMEKGVVYVDALIANGRYEEAQDWAEEIEKLARKLRYPRLRAVALNRAGKATVLAGKRMTCGRRPVVIDPHLDDYAAAYPGFLILNPAKIEQVA